jgi:hypothetical protein
MPLLLMLLLQQQQLRLPLARLACRYSSRGISTCSSCCSVQRARAFGNTTAIAATAAAAAAGGSVRPASGKRL